jgi:hypothetical protein
MKSQKNQQEIVVELARAFKELHISWKKISNTTIRATLTDNNPG